jgi:hypothetical protein
VDFPQPAASISSKKSKAKLIPEQREEWEEHYSITTYHCCAAPKAVQTKLKAVINK